MSVPIETNEYVAYLRHVRDVVDGLPDAVVPPRDKRRVRELVGLETTGTAPPGSVPSNGPWTRSTSPSWPRPRGTRQPSAT